MVVTCYSRTCSRPELPISSAKRKCVRAYARVHEREHAYRCNDTVHERTTQEQERTYMSAECERICRLLWCLRLLPQWRWKEKRRRRRERKKKNAMTKNATRNVTISSLFFSRSLSLSFSFLQLSLSYALTIHLFLSCSSVLGVNEINWELLRFIAWMCFHDFRRKQHSLISFSGHLQNKKIRRKLFTVQLPCFLAGKSCRTMK